MGEYITEIVVSAFQYLTWPISIVILARIFKEQIKGVSKIKIKDYEIELQNEITKIAEDINKINREWKITSTKFLKDNMLGLFFN